MTVGTMGVAFLPLILAAGAVAVFIIVAFLVSLVFQAGMGVAMLLINNKLQQNPVYALEKKRGQLWRNLVAIVSIAFSVASIVLCVLALNNMAASAQSPGFQIFQYCAILLSYLFAVALGITFLVTGAKLPRGSWKVMRVLCILFGILVLLCGLLGAIFTGSLRFMFVP